MDNQGFKVPAHPKPKELFIFRCLGRSEHPSAGKTCLNYIKGKADWPFAWLESSNWPKYLPELANAPDTLKKPRGQGSNQWTFHGYCRPCFWGLSKTPGEPKAEPKKIKGHGWGVLNVPNVNIQDGEDINKGITNYWFFGWIPLSHSKETLETSAEIKKLVSLFQLRDELKTWEKPLLEEQYRLPEEGASSTHDK